MTVLQTTKLRAFWRQEGGGIALVFGLALPVLIGTAAGAVDYAELISRRAALQAVADGAALAAGQELTLAGVDDTRVVNVGKSVASSDVARNPKLANYSATINGQVVNRRTEVEVTIGQTVGLMIGKVMGWPSADVTVKAVARVSGSQKLCLVGLDPSSDATVRMDKLAKLTATECAIYSDSKSPLGLSAKDQAVLTAQSICTAGGFTGRPGTNFSPTPITDCPSIPDPLSSRPAPVLAGGGCDYVNTVINGQKRTITPGVYCGGLKIGNGAQVTASEGTYVIDGGALTVNGGATLQGEYVGFYFRGDLATVNFGYDTIISLSAPKMGDMSGILFFEDRAAPLLRSFGVSSDNARKLLGTIYLSRGLLSIDANKPVADQSAYTVIVARQVRLSAGPNLVLNTNYGGTDVPVPKGVGPLGPTVNLSK